MYLCYVTKMSDMPTKAKLLRNLKPFHQKWIIDVSLLCVCMRVFQVQLIGGFLKAVLKLVYEMGPQAENFYGLFIGKGPSGPFPQCLL